MPAMPAPGSSDISVLRTPNLHAYTHSHHILYIIKIIIKVLKIPFQSRKLQWWKLKERAHIKMPACNSCFQEAEAGRLRQGHGNLVYLVLLGQPDLNNNNNNTPTTQWEIQDSGLRTPARLWDAFVCPCLFWSLNAAASVSFNLFGFIVLMFWFAFIYSPEGLSSFCI